MKRLKAMALAAAGSALLAACGGGNSHDGTASDSAPLSKPAFIKEANSICRKGLAEKESLLQAELRKLEGHGKTPSKGEIEELATKLLPPFQQMADQLASLSSRSGDQGQVTRIVTQLEGGLKEAEEDPGVLVEKNPFLAAHKSALAYGLKSCRF